MRISWRLLAILSLTGCATVGAAARVPQSMQPRSVAPEPGLAKLVQPKPTRNLYLLTRQIKLHTTHPIPKVIRKTSPNYPVGHQDTFSVLSEDTNKYFKLTATIRAETPHLYLYVENGVNVDAQAAQNAANTFEKSIYPTDRSYFGSEWRPGVDGDTHITCLVGNLRSATAAGMYSAEDEYPRQVNRGSNEREMFEMNAPDTTPGTDYFNDIISHEFQHMIHWHMHPGDNAWLNEGMSTLAEKINGYPPNDEARSFLDLPGTQLNTWTVHGPDVIPHYGGAYLYLLYLYEHYGRSLIREIVADKKYTDFQLIDDALRKLHKKTSATKLFTDWVVANLVNNRSVSNGRYGYKGFSSRLTVNNSTAVGSTYQGTIPPWAAQYVDISGADSSRPFTLTFAGPRSVPLVSFAKAAPGWWSNRGDMMQTELQRSVDLTHVKHATLHFKAVYDIEKNYDYVYLEASTDGGKTWKTLPATDTTNKDPTGANFGNGFTGGSKGLRSESANLSPYAGKRILIRFQYVTDDEYNGEGMMIRDITIPQIHFKDTFSGWTAHGFVPVRKNALPSTWTVQLVETTKDGTVVQRVPVGTSGHGSITVDPGKLGLKHLTAVIFSTAPKTTVKSTFTLSTAAS